MSASHSNPPKSRRAGRYRVTLESGELKTQDTSVKLQDATPLIPIARGNMSFSFAARAVKGISMTCGFEIHFLRPARTSGDHGSYFKAWNPLDLRGENQL